MGGATGCLDKDIWEHAIELVLDVGHFMHAEGAGEKGHGMIQLDLLSGVDEGSS